jgi:hypothetical protein
VLKLLPFRNERRWLLPIFAKQYEEDCNPIGERIVMKDRHAARFARFRVEFKRIYNSKPDTYSSL